MIPRLCFALVALLFWATAGSAHESRPAYLDIRELQPGRYEVLWKRPMQGDRALGLSVAWPEPCQAAASGSTQAVPGALIERRLIGCGPDSLVGRRIGIEGLAGTLTDTLVRIAFLDGTTQTNLVKPAAPWLEVEGPRPALAVSGEYFALGVEHILGGLDHPMFVLGLTLIVRGTARLVKTFTAFTVAHSLTLGGAMLGWVAVPQAPSRR